MKQILLICAVMALVGCGKKDDGNTGVVNPNKPSPKAVPVNIADPIVEKAIRKSLKKPTGELTKADLEKVTRLSLKNNQLTEVPKDLEFADNKLIDVKGLEKLTQLSVLFQLMATPTSPRLRLTNCKRRCRSAESSATSGNRPHSSP